MTKILLLVGTGGFLGSISRYLVQDWFVRTTNTTIPWGTFVANVVGSLIIGIIYALVEKQGAFSQEIRLLFAVGFCGGFTTFSSFAMEKFTMLRSGELLPLFTYLSLSIITGLFMVWLGVSLVKWVS